MKKIIITTLFFLPLSVFAQSSLSAIFNPNPLFSASNFMPEDKKEASVIISNNTEILQSAYVEAVNVSNADNLASQMQIKIFEGITEIYNNNFETFINAGPVSLSSIGSSNSKKYDFKITFIENTGNDYQSKTLGFDICVGFSGGLEHCTGETVISDEEGETSGGGGSDGSRGSSGGSHLLIFNERNETPAPKTTTITIYWETNKPATSQVIYGLASGAPYTLDLNILPGFGYPLYNSENLNKVINHSMLLTGLIPGETYVYRVVSRASPATISYEHQFTVPTSSQTDNAIISGPLGISWGEILGASSQNNGTSTSSTSDESNLAAVFSAGWNGPSWWWIWLLLILLVAYLIWRFVFKKEKTNY